MSGEIPPSKIQNRSIKDKILRPALTSHFHVQINLPVNIGNPNNSINLKDNSLVYDSELLLLSCCEASLPGSTIATHELNNDFTGLTERHAYRRLYDDRIDLTFYVNEKYYQIRFFEAWMRYVTGEKRFGESNNDGIKYFRMNYPDTYKSENMFVVKFERDFGLYNGKEQDVSTYIRYKFSRVFPISIQSMPISYESSNLLKCTVSFTYDRYVIDDLTIKNENKPITPLQPRTPQEQADLNTIFTNPQFNTSDLYNNVAPGLFNISPGSLTNGSFGNPQQVADALGAFNSNKPL